MARRRRNAVLHSLELFRALHPNISLTHVVAFFYVAENEGLSITELGDALGTTIATASRTARALYDEGRPAALPPGLGLVESQPHPVIANARPLHLTPLGADLRNRIDGIIQIASPIAPNAQGAGEVSGRGITGP